MDFEQRLREERARLGLGQGELAERAGVSREMWNRYERGGAKPNADVLVRLHECGMDVAFVIGGVRLVGDATLSAQERLLVEHFRCTDDEGRAVVARAASMEAQRLLAATRGPYAPAPAVVPLLLHDAPPKRKR
jgi:transcriptional regulator with XRE-family HTH domain